MCRLTQANPKIKDSLVFQSSGYQYKIRSSTDGYCALNALLHLIPSACDISVLRASFESISEDEKGGITPATLINICAKIGIPVLSISQFYAQFAIVNI